MKKHDEGYVLVYVTVVLLVFCLVAAMILTGALHNLNQQQAANQKMKDQYLAAGEIEKVMAQWDACQDGYAPGEPVGDTAAVWHEMEQDEAETEVYVFSASSGEVMITCKVYADGTYYSYEVGTKPADGGDGQ